MIAKIYALQSPMVAEVIEMTKRLHRLETLSVSSPTRLEDKFSQRIERLEGLLQSAIDETLKQIFQETGAKVIYNYLENKCHLRREEIMKKADVFSAALKTLLVSASPVIEKSILENLYSKVELQFEERGRLQVFRLHYGVEEDLSLRDGDYD